MQNQPALIELGLARLELLKTICLPTLQQQSSQNFLWIIRADPQLAAPVKDALLELVHNATKETPDFHVVVMGTNDNPMGFRRDLWTTTDDNNNNNDNNDTDSTIITTTPDSVWTNNVVLLEHFHEASQSRIVLETRLDADDGLHILFVELMQEEAVLYLDDTEDGDFDMNDNKNNDHNWLVWCAGTHVEWQYGTPWGDLHQGQSSIMLNGTELPATTSSSVLPKHNKRQPPSSDSSTKERTEEEDSAFGSLLPGLTRGCITPGLTKGYGRKVNFEDIPEAQHHQLHWQMKQCKEDDDEKNASGSSPALSESESLPSWHQCLVIWKRLIPNAIRGRTPTSAGMQFVLGGKHTSYMSDEAMETLGLEDNNYHDMQGMMWTSVQKRFSITKESIAQMRTFLTEHMHGVAQDNLVGQCTKGHSCKNSSQVLLQQLLEETAHDTASDPTATQ